MRDVLLRIAPGELAKIDAKLIEFAGKGVAKVKEVDDVKDIYGADA